MAQHKSGSEFSTPLRNLILTYMQTGFSADMFFPETRVTGTKGEFRMVSPTLYVVEDTGPLPDDGELKRIDQDSTIINYTMDRYGVYTSVPDASIRRNGGGSDLEMEAAEDLAQHLLLEKEIEAKTIVETSSNYSTVEGPTDGHLWDTDNADPAGQIIDLKEKIRLKIGVYPTHMSMAASTWAKVRRQKKLRELLSDTDRGFVSRQAFCNFVEMPAENFIVQTAIYNTKPQGVDAVNADIWGKNFTMWANYPGRRTTKWAVDFVPRTTPMRTWRGRDDKVPGLNIYTEGWRSLQVVMKDAGAMVTNVIG